jgi:hypothetical protein
MSDPTTMFRWVLGCGMALLLGGCPVGHSPEHHPVGVSAPIRAGSMSHTT